VACKSHRIPRRRCKVRRMQQGAEASKRSISANLLFPYTIHDHAPQSRCNPFEPCDRILYGNWDVRWASATKNLSWGAGRCDAEGSATNGKIGSNYPCVNDHRWVRLGLQVAEAVCIASWIRLRELLFVVYDNVVIRQHLARGAWRMVSCLSAIQNRQPEYC